MDKIWEAFLMALCTTLVVCLILMFSRPKHTVRYELHSDMNTGIPAIYVDIENGSDRIIHLSKEVSWSKAIQMVDSLNKTLKPIK